MYERSNVVVWHCAHCSRNLPGVLPGSLPNCPFCLHSQQPPETPERSSADKSQTQDNDHDLSVDAHRQYEQQKQPSEDNSNDSEVANGNSEQLSTLAQGATTLLESTTTEALEPFPDLLEQEHTPLFQKLPKDVPSKQDPTANPNPNLQPVNQPYLQMGDSSTDADQVSFWCTADQVLALYKLKLVG